LIAALDDNQLFLLCHLWWSQSGHNQSGFPICRPGYRYFQRFSQSRRSQRNRRRSQRNQRRRSQRNQRRRSRYHFRYRFPCQIYHRKFHCCPAQHLLRKKRRGG
jgi:hypothetical protein